MCPEKSVEIPIEPLQNTAIPQRLLKMTTKEKKAKVRNFTFLAEADKELLRRMDVTGKTMTAVLEDLLLGRRQFNPETERFLRTEVERTGSSRNEIIEAALVAYQASHYTPEPSSRRDTHLLAAVKHVEAVREEKRKTRGSRSTSHDEPRP